MKLLMCLRCQDVVKIQRELRHCRCGRSHGFTEDGDTAHVNSHCRVLGIVNEHIGLAMSVVDSARYRGEPIAIGAMLLPDPHPRAKRIKR